MFSEPDATASTQRKSMQILIDDEASLWPLGGGYQFCELSGRIFFHGRLDKKCCLNAGYLLVLFLAHPGRMFTRQDIFQHFLYSEHYIRLSRITSLIHEVRYLLRDTHLGITTYYRRGFTLEAVKSDCPDWLQYCRQSDDFLSIHIRKE